MLSQKRRRFRKFARVVSIRTNAFWMVIANAMFAFCASIVVVLAKLGRRNWSGIRTGRSPLPPHGDNLPFWSVGTPIYCATMKCHSASICHCADHLNALGLIIVQAMLILKGIDTGFSPGYGGGNLEFAGIDQRSVFGAFPAISAD